MVAYILMVVMAVLVGLKVGFVMFGGIDCGDETCEHFFFIENWNNNTMSICERNEQRID